MSSNALYDNHYFKHKFYKENIIRSKVKKGAGNDHHLYIELVQGDEIKGMSTSETFMLATTIQLNIKELGYQILMEWTKNNQYQSHSIKRFTSTEAAMFISECETYAKKHSLRIGQSMIILLGDDTPTPNPAIFYCTDNNVAYDWLAENHIENE